MSEKDESSGLIRSRKVTEEFYGDRRIVTTTTVVEYPADEGESGYRVDGTADGQVEAARRALEAVQQTAAKAEAQQQAIYGNMDPVAYEVQLETDQQFIDPAISILTHDGYVDPEDFDLDPVTPEDHEVPEHIICQHLNVVGQDIDGVYFSECVDCGASLVGA